MKQSSMQSKLNRQIIFLFLIIMLFCVTILVGRTVQTQVRRQAKKKRENQTSKFPPPTSTPNIPKTEYWKSLVSEAWSEWPASIFPILVLDPPPPKYHPHWVWLLLLPLYPSLTYSSLLDCLCNWKWRDSCKDGSLCPTWKCITKRKIIPQEPELQI